MAIKQKLQQKVPRIEIDLTGPQGNVFVLIATAKRLARQVSVDGDKVVKRMMRGSYSDAINIFDSAFGDYVTLFVDNSVELN
jgi:hypothetical protein